MSKSAKLNPQRGEVWDVDFDPQVGNEIGKVRPAVVISVVTVGKLALRVIVPITTGNSHSALHSWMVPIVAQKSNGLSHDSYADAFQVKSLALERFRRQRGVLTDDEVNVIAGAIALVVGYQPPTP
jgi:mRNA interferase MazF